MDTTDTVAPRRPSTADPDVIETPVRQFAARVLAVRADFHAGIGPLDPLPLIEAEARTFSAALSLTAHGRAYWMVLLPDETKHTRDPGAALGLWMAGQLVQMAEAVEDGRHTEDSIKPKISDLLSDVMVRLTGAKH